MNDYFYMKTTFDIDYIQNKDAAFNIHDVRVTLADICFNIKQRVISVGIRL